MRLRRPRPRALTLHAALFLITLAAAIGCRAQTGLLALDTFPKSHLRITSGAQKHDFDIWLATTPDQQQQGLMFVRDLPASRGMLFLADEPKVFRMWMKNTYIPLDMVFIDANGRIAKIAANTVPHSLATVSSETEVAGILEIRGGEAARRGLHVGDEVSWEPPAGAQRSP
jgi:uncharacterized protein